MVEALIDRLLDLNINIELIEEDKLKIHSDINSMPQDLLTEIKQAKPALVAYLKENRVSKGFQKIPNVPLQSSYALSSSQRRLWILNQLEEGSVAYNISGVYVFNGQLDQNALEYALETLLERHEVLRVVFREDETGGARQFVNTVNETGFSLNHMDLHRSGMETATLDELLQKDAVTPFDLATGPLIRATLYRLEEHKWVFSYVMHHIISDGWSMDILISELMAVYNGKLAGKENVLSPLRIQYKDYAAWQQAQLTGDTLGRHKEYWLGQFEGELPVLEMTGDKPRPAVQTFNGERISRKLGSRIPRGLNTIGQQGITLFMRLLAAVNVLLYKYTKQEDIIIGSPIAGREHADLENQIGFYINTLALRSRFKGSNSFNELLENIRQATLGAYEYQAYPFDQLVNDLHLKKDRSRNTLFDVAMTLQDGGNTQTTAALNLDNLNISRYEGREKLICKFDLLFVFVLVGEELHVSIEYNRDIYTRATADRLADNLGRLLEAIIQDPQKPLADLEYLSSNEKELLHGFNSTVSSYPENINLVKLFEEQVRANPDNTALSYRDTTLTYAALNEKSNQVAHYLKSQYDLRPDDLVGIMLDRSDKMIISMLGVLKAGAAYVPIDTTYPKSRKEFIVNEADIRLLITQTDYMFDLDFYQGGLFAIDVQLDTLDTDIVNPDIEIDPASLAYVIYTSGSTGEPKGVMIAHRAIANTILSQIEIFDIHSGDRGLQFASASFDASVSEIFIILAAGGALYIISEEDKTDPSLLQQYIQKNRIDIATIPPAFLQLLDVEEIRTMGKLITAGDAAVRNAVDSYSRTGDYFNAYGPTETSICATIQKINSENPVTQSNVPIGKPIANTEIYILDENLQLLPIGVPGEICIGGAGLARGYFKKPALTAKSFPEHPFNNGHRIYRTGDIGRWLPDGTVEFLGRRDNQVKLNGYRIELEEIAHVLLKEQVVQEAVAIVKNDKDGNKDLVLYYVPDNEIAYTSHKIAENKEKGLPERAALYPLPNGMQLYAYNRSEIELLFEEVFTDNLYLKHGICIPDNGCVVDIGANMGMFSVYASMAASDVKVYACEPLPPIFELLKLNASLFNKNIEVLNIGLSDKEETASFTYFPESTALSSRYAEEGEVKDTVRKFIQNKEQPENIGITEADIDELLESHLQQEKYDCPLKTLSQVIAENNITTIDLLKIDVEKSELDVLNGISKADWKKIKQVALEIHDIDSRLEVISKLLMDNGFSVFVEQSQDLAGTALYDVYAVAEGAVITTGTVQQQKWTSAKELKEQIREVLASRLPAYMIPGHFIQLDKLPLTSNGKIDRKRLPDPEGMTVDTGTAYIGGRNEAELHLIAVFEEVLKKHPISVKDDFFALGGDSIKSIQIVSRLKQKGYSLMIQDVMLHSIVEDLAQRLQVVSRQIGQDVVEGMIPLSPIQAAFFEEDQVDKHHFNQSVLLRSHSCISEASLRAALSELVLHHDALRMVYRQTPEGWVQENKGAGQGYLLEVFDNADDQSFIAHCERLQSTASLENGPLFRAALFHGTTGDRLLLVAHHLVMDGVSWRILFDDLSLLYQQHEAGEPLQLPLKTDAFKYWQEKQLAYAQSEALLEEDAYWSSIEATTVATLLPDYPQGSNLVKDTGFHTFSLDEQTTSRLLTECYKAYQTEINDILLTALSLALSESFNLNKVLIKLEGHGREDIGYQTDITRTVGWFTTTYPVVFDMESRGDTIRQLIAVKETLHRVPNKGIGYGVLRYLGGKHYRLDPAISFNYLGDFGHGVETAGGERLFEFSGEYHGADFSKEMQRGTLLDVSGKIVQGRLRFSIGYSTSQYSALTIRSLAAAYKQHLEMLIEQLSSEDNVRLSPVDLTYKQLSVDQLESLYKLLNK